MNVLSVVPSPDSVSYRRRVAALERRGVNIVSVSPEGRHSPGAESRSVHDYASLYPRMLTASLSGIDLVHASQGIMGPFGLAQPTRPVVLSLWGSDLLGGLEPVSQVCARLSSAVVVMSEHMANRLHTEAAVIPHGVDFDRFRPRDRIAARSSLGWDANARIVLFPAHPDRAVKNYPLAKRVVATVSDRLDRSVKLYALFDVPHENVPIYMNAADALILCSHHEGSPNVVKEALACNLPVVSTPVGDVERRLEGVSPSAVRRSEAGLATALERILTDPCRSNGRSAVDGLTEDRMAERLYDVFRRCVGR